jgi:hypothetical protein
MAATVLAGMGASERVLTGERLDSSQPPKSPAAGVNNDKAKNLFAIDLLTIGHPPVDQLALPKKQTTLNRHPCSKVTGTFI